MTQQPYIHCLVQYVSLYTLKASHVGLSFFPLLILVILVLHLFVLLSYWPFSDFSARTLQHITCASYFLHCNVNSSTELFSCLCPDPAAQSKLDLGRMVFACTLNVWVCVISCQWVESATKGKQMG